MWRRVAMFGLSAPVLTFLLWSCNSHKLEKPDPDPVGETTQYREINPIRNVDVVFVVDNSGSMQEEQQNLATNFEVFMRELTAIQGGDFHIGVVSTDLGGGATTQEMACARMGGDNAVFCSVNGVDNCARCGLTAGTGRFIKTANPNYPGGPTNLPSVFSCMARIGTQGCGFEHSLGALRNALTRPENEGFLRQDSYLAFVIITDEEDCTAPPDSQLFATPIAGQNWSLRCYTQAVTCNGMKNDGNSNVSLPFDSCQVDDQSQLVRLSEIFDAVVATKGGNLDRIIATGIFGWPFGQEANSQYQIGGGQGGRGMRAICNSTNGDATPAYRVKKFLDSFPNRAMYSICESDFREAMRQIGARIRGTVGSPCIDARLVDIYDDPPNVLDPDCSVVERRPSGGGKFEQFILPRCSAGVQGACWNLNRNPACTASGYEVLVDRKGEQEIEGTQQSIRCLTHVGN